MNIILLSIVAVSTYFGSSDAGYSKRNQFLDRTEYYNRNGFMEGYSKHNNLLDRQEYYNRSGQIEGYSKYNPLLDRTEYHDSSLKTFRNY